MKLAAGLFVLAAVALAAGCGDSDVTAGEFGERYCNYKATSEANAANCLTYLASQGDIQEEVESELRGRYAQAALYALGEIKGCLSRSGPLCKQGDWPLASPDRSFLVARYCLYGSVSRAQLKGCVTHVDRETVASYSTPAARYARGDLIYCGPSAGPFCTFEGELR
jgi:hypothetical protein